MVESGACWLHYIPAGTDLAFAKHQPYLARWVREFLLFPRDHGRYTFEQTLDLFLAKAGERVGTKPWQLQHGRWDSMAIDERAASASASVRQPVFIGMLLRGMPGLGSRVGAGSVVGVV